MNPIPEDAEHIEQSAAVLLTRASLAASELAELAFQDDRYDDMAALAAGAHATRATGYLPLPDAFPTDINFAIDYQDLIRRVEAAADALDELGRRSTDVREVRDRHMAAMHARDAAIALRNALPIEQETAG